MIRRLVCLLSALAVAPAAAQRSLAITGFDATIGINRDASIDVSETITARFNGSWNGLYRTIPVEYRTPQGFNWNLRLDFLGATMGPEATPLRVERSRSGHYLKIKVWVPGAVNATRTITLHYRAFNGLRFFPDHDELYWNVTGDEWDVPLEAATATITLPPGATGVRAIAFNGVYGSTARDARVEQTATSVRLTMPHRLDFHEGLTAVVGWDKGAVVEPTATDRAADFLASNWPLAVPIPVFLGVFLLWVKVGKDPERLPVVVQYQPPAGLTPAEAGTLIDESADMRDITATLVDLAVRGFIRIREHEVPMIFGLVHLRDYFFDRLEPPAATPPLEPHETKVRDGIFADGGTTVKLSDLENEFYRQLPGIRDSIFQRLVDRGLYRSRPDRVRNRWLVYAVLVGGGLLAIGSTLTSRFGVQPAPVILGGVLSALIVALFGRIMPARTVSGARALEQVLGFEEFLRRVESEHYARVVKTPEMFEKFLPFAMAFRVEKHWTRAFEGICKEPPQWFVAAPGGGPFSLSGFSSRLSYLSTRTASTMSSSPRSSGGSGFSGGSSGGGGGGGGGGGF
jgi:Predicted membrane protein (DUF2207) C-terminal domain/Predicted membrane protein (DUF2207) N-terminal domain